MPILSFGMKGGAHRLRSTAPTTDLVRQRTRLELILKRETA
jgi:hypothetical protein